MNYRHGVYVFPQSTVAIQSHTRVMETNERGKNSLFRETIACTGELKATGQAAIKAEIDAIKAAFVPSVSESGMLHDSGSRSGHYLLAAGTVAGIKTPVRPSFPDSRGAEYATHRSFNFVVEAETFASPNELWAYSDSLRFIGNCGPRLVFIELDTGEADIQEVSTNTIQTIIQSGIATGTESWPTVPPPFYASGDGIVELMNPDSAIDYLAPQLQGSRFAFHTVRWNYIFKAKAPQLGLPVGQ